GRLPVAARSAAGRNQYAHGDAASLGAVHERGNRRRPACGQRGDRPYFAGGRRSSGASAAREPVAPSRRPTQQSPPQPTARDGEQARQAPLRRLSPRRANHRVTENTEKNTEEKKVQIGFLSLYSCSVLAFSFLCFSLCSL